MDFKMLEDFLRHQMRMSHVYQPAMILTLLESDGGASVNDVAKGLLIHDQSQIEYYEKITKTMPGPVLQGRHVVKPRHQGRRIIGYELSGFSGLASHEIEALKELCKQRIAEYIERRGAAIWQHRRKSHGYISGTLRYEVFKRAGFRCELCGVSADHCALEVDHITPRNHGGDDSSENLQALCYACNAMKRDRDDTDFRAVRESHECRDPDCLFCNLPAERVIDEDSLAYVIRDGFPVTAYHTLIIPKRHTADYFDLYQSEINAVTRLLKSQKARIQEQDSTVAGFNVGINSGAIAGQTVMHCHIHLIPRRARDVENPRGGVRNTIPGMGDYHASPPENR